MTRARLEEAARAASEYLHNSYRAMQSDMNEDAWRMLEAAKILDAALALPPDGGEVVRERLARALHASFGGSSTAWERGLNEQHRDSWRDTADAILREMGR